MVDSVTCYNASWCPDHHVYLWSINTIKFCSPFTSDGIVLHGVICPQSSPTLFSRFYTSSLLLKLIVADTPAGRCEANPIEPLLAANSVTLFRRQKWTNFRKSILSLLSKGVRMGRWKEPSSESLIFWCHLIGQVGGNLAVYIILWEVGLFQGNKPFPVLQLKVTMFRCVS